MKTYTAFLNNVIVGDVTVSNKENIEDAKKCLAINGIEYDYVGKKPLPSEVRIAKKSLDNSLKVLSIGKFNKSGRGTKAYHESNVNHLNTYMIRFGHLLTMRAKPTKTLQYYETLVIE